MAQKSAILKHRPVRPHCRGHRLTGISGCVLKGQIVGLESVAVDLHGLREKCPAGLFRVQAVGNHHVRRRLPHAHQRDIGVVLGHDHPLVVNPGRDLDIHAARLAIRPLTGKGMVIHRHLNRGKRTRTFRPSLYIRRNAHVHVLRVASAARLQKATCRHNRNGHRQSTAHAPILSLSNS